MFKRLSNLVRGMVSQFVGGLEKQSPEALLELAKEELREQTVRFNKGLASQAATCERMVLDAKRLDSRIKELKAKITARLSAGQREEAGALAVELQGLQSEHAETLERAEAAETEYKNLSVSRDRDIAAAKERIAKLTVGVAGLKNQRSEARKAESASGSMGELGQATGDGSLDRLASMVAEERAKAAGRSRVARDSRESTTAPPEPIADSKALAEQALEEFLAAQGAAPASESQPPANTVQPAKPAADDAPAEKPDDDAGHSTRSMGRGGSD